MKEVYPGIFMITHRTPLRVMKPPVNIYAMPGDDGLVFDGGYGNRKYLRRTLRELDNITKITGGSFTRILLSHGHPDHFAGIADLARRYGLKILLTRSMWMMVRSSPAYYRSYETTPPETISNPILRILYRLIRSLIHRLYVRLYGIRFITAPDQFIDSEDIISINGDSWEIFPSPGHADDHISLYNRDQGILFAGDNILRSKTSWLGPPRSDLMKYIRSMEEILSLPDLALVLSAHGSPITSPSSRIKEIIDWRKKRIEDVFNALSPHKDGLSLKELYRILYPGEGWFKYKMTEGWMRLTLCYLIEMNRIKSFTSHRGKELYRVIDSKE